MIFREGHDKKNIILLLKHLFQEQLPPPERICGFAELSFRFVFARRLCTRRQRSRCTPFSDEQRCRFRGTFLFAKDNRDRSTTCIDKKTEFRVEKDGTSWNVSYLDKASGFLEDEDSVIFKNRREFFRFQARSSREDGGWEQLCKRQAEQQCSSISNNSRPRYCRE